MGKFDRSRLRSLLSNELGSLWKEKKLQKCFDLCFEAHQGQFREVASESMALLPYIVHPVGVAVLCNRYYNSKYISDNHLTIIMAALAHDVLEDTAVGSTEITRVCGERTTEIVSMLTKPPINPSENNADRNELFAQRIIAAGSSAMFIKICDSMHNLSRPEHSPAKLMEKAIRKGRGEYAQFFKRGLKHPELENAFFNQIQQTSSYLAEHRFFLNENSQVSLKEIISKSFDIHNQKALEIHDLLEFSESKLGYTFARVMRESRIISELGVLSDNQQVTGLINRSLENGILQTKKLPKKVQNIQFLAGIDELHLFPMEKLLGVQNKEQHFLVLGINYKTIPDWLTYKISNLILYYLSEKNRELNRNQYIELERSAANLGLEVTVEQLSSNNIEYHKLLELRDLIRYCEFIRCHFANVLANRINSIESIELMLPIESRAKEASSILEKMFVRKLFKFDDLDDLVGIRLICRNENDRKLIEKICKEEVANWNQGKAEPTRLKFVSINTNVGYQARHLNFIVENPVDDDQHVVQKVGCEIQVRTMFEDAWARISGSVTYKALDQNKGNRKVLRDMAELRNQAEILANKLK